MNKLLLLVLGIILLSIPNILAVTIPQASNGLFFYEYNTSTKYPVDSLGNSNGELFNATWQFDLNGGGFITTLSNYTGTNGVNGKTRISSGSFTIAGWFNTGTTSNNGFLFTQRDGSASDDGLQLGTRNGNTELYYKPQDASANGIISYPLSQNSWTHIAVTYNSGTGNKSLFINGSRVNSTTAGTQSYPPFNSTFLGSADPDENPNGQNYSVDDSGVWSVALSESEINTLYSTSNPPQTSSNTGLYVTAYDTINSEFVNNFTLNLYYDNDTLVNTSTTSDGNVFFPIFSNEDYYALFNSSGYQNARYNFSFTGTNVIYQFSITPAPSINITFYDESTNELIEGSLVNADIIGSDIAYNLSTTTGSVFKELNTAGSYNIIFYGTGYLKKFYEFSVNSGSYEEISLYLTNESTGYSNITATITDQYFNELEGAVLVVQKLIPSLNQYIVSERVEADFEGKTIFKGLLYEEYYKFSIYYDDDLVFSSIPTTIKDDTIDFAVTLGDAGNQDYYDLLNLDYIIGFNETLNRFRFSYSNGDGIVSSIKLVTSRLTANGDVLVNTTTTSSSSATIYHYVSNITGYSYKSCAYGYLYGNYELIDCEAHTYTETIGDAAGPMILFLLGFLVVLFALMGFSQSISLGLVLAPIPLLIFEGLGFSTIGIPIALSIEIIMIIVALVINKN